MSDSSQTHQPVDYLVIGHITKDVVADGYTVGGTVTYGALTAHNLGLRVGMVTSYGPDFALPPVLDGITIARIPAPETTTFSNIYYDGRRQQIVHAVASPITPDAVPPAWRHSPIVHLGPLVNEISVDILDLFDDGILKGVTPQGWMRQWDGRGHVNYRRWESAEEILSRVDVLVFSEEDVANDPGEIERLTRLARIAVVTHGPGGATLYLAGQPTHYPGFEAHEVDPTGAGDVFAAAFLVRLRETNDPHAATHFANAVASLSIEGPGIQGIPTRAQVEERLQHGRLRER